MTLLRANRKQSGRSEDDSVDATECTDGHEYRDDPGHRSKYFLAEYYSGRQVRLHFTFGEHSKVGHVHKDIDDGDDGHRDPDGTGEVPGIYRGNGQK